jgi:hypothetical protein
MKEGKIVSYQGIRTSVGRKRSAYFYFPRSSQIFFMGMKGSPIALT